MAFEIHIFEGDPSRGVQHKGFMFSLRLEDGSYYKSKWGYSSEEVAAVSAVEKAAKLKKASCQT